MTALVLIGVLIYPIGIPLTYFLTVYRLRHILTRADRDVHDPSIRLVVGWGAYCQASVGFLLLPVAPFVSLARV